MARDRGTPDEGIADAALVHGSMVAVKQASEAIAEDPLGTDSEHVMRQALDALPPARLALARLVDQTGGRHPSLRLVRDDSGAGGPVQAEGVPVPHRSADEGSAHNETGAWR